MALPAKINKALQLTRRARGLFRPTKALFLMSHMRSRSSMLSHVLGSHERIAGYYEMSRSYRDVADLNRMKMAHLVEGRDKPRAAYYQDKVLHNRFSVGDDVAASSKARFLFLVREPAASISSLLELGKRRPVPECQSAEAAITYYVERLHDLEMLAQRLHEPFLFIESDQLIEHADRELDRLTQWLQLDTPLRAEYERFSKTGVGSFGDTSESIHRGIIHDNRADPLHEIPAAVLAPAHAAYEHHLTFMNQHAI